MRDVGDPADVMRRLGTAANSMVLTSLSRINETLLRSRLGPRNLLKKRAELCT